MANKKQQLVRKCIELMGKAEGVLECPVCFHNSKNMVQCLTGHHICKKCQEKLNECPTCKNEFLGTKPFLMEDLSDALDFIKLSLSDLEEDVKRPIDTKEVQTVRKLLKTILFHFSSYCHKNKTFLLLLNRYIQNPAENREELEKQLGSLTSDLRSLTGIINDTEMTLTSLKK